uniref:Uncharacterized protein n=1 Tax=Tetradesmus obliquus TaxID=3088 RepID=A0A383V7Z6_TETOB|eukprot:jgi/Sobl393_1/3097/SZX61291.1
MLSSSLRSVVPVQRAASSNHLHRTRLFSASGQHATSISSSQGIVGGQERESDHFVDAAYRLESLLCGVGDGEDELYYNLLLEEEPGHKLQVNALLGAVVLAASTAICWLCGKDPAGGASLSLNSLQAGLIGAAAAAPLVAYKLFSWTPPAQQQNPTLAALKRAQIDISRPWLSNMNREQLAAHVVLDTLPLLFLMLPAAQAGLTASFYWTSQAIGRSTGLQLPEEVGFMIALFMTAAVTSAVRSTELMADPEQVNVVGDAVANADRYYRLTTSSPSSSSGSSQEAVAALRARAFKAIAISWREQEQEITSLFVTLAMMDFLYLGGLWYITHDMTAPCVAALLANAVDYHAMWKGVTTPGAGRGGRGGRGGANKARSSSSSSTQRE